MKSQQEGCGWPRRTSRSRDNWSRDLEHKLFSVLFCQLQAVLGQETQKSCRWTLVLPAEFWGFWLLISLYDREPTGNKQGPPVSKRKQNLSSGLCRTFWGRFTPELKRDVDVARVNKDKMWYREDYWNHLNSKRRLKKGYLQQEQTFEEITMGLWGSPSHPHLDIDSIIKCLQINTFSMGKKTRRN